MIVSQIAAMSENRVIGVANKLPWHIPEDLKFFRQKTAGRIVILGRKTFESVGSKPLPKRLNIVVTRDKSFRAPAGVLVCHSVKESLELAAAKTAEWGDEVFIVGGAEIYKQVMDQTDRIYLTLVHRKLDGDAFFPEFDPKQFQLVEQIDRSEPEAFSFLTYERKK